LILDDKNTNKKTEENVNLIFEKRAKLKTKFIEKINGVAILIALVHE
jgi:hypothetical protein